MGRIQFIKNLGLRHQMRFAILIVAVICTVAAAVTNYIQTKQWMEQSYVELVDNKVTMQAKRFDSIMQSMYLMLNQLSCSEQLTTCIDTYLDSERTFADSVKISNELKNLLTMQEYDSALYLYIPETEQMFSSLEYYAVQELDRANVLLWNNRSDNPFAPLFYMNYFTGSAEYVFGYASPIKGADGEQTAMLCLTVDERQVYYDLLEPLNNNQNGEIYLVLRENGMICSSTQISQLGCIFKDSDRIQSKRMQAEELGDGRMNLSVEAPYTGCYLLCQSDLNSLTVDLRRQLQLTIVVVLLMFLAAVVASIGIARWMYQPIESLVGTLRRVGEGDFAARVPEEDMDDDLRVVARGFNDLMSHIDDLMERIVRERMEKREAEINALQYQIRPHFMYNTLNSIRLAALMQRNQKLAELLADFIELLEASIQRKGAFVTVKEEIELVQHFLSLQAFRYFDCFEAIIEIEPEAENCYVPCLLLQPMVENAVFHGIDTTRNDNVLTVTARVEQDRLRISIVDNGNGFDSEKKSHENRRLTGIGLKNVNQRLKLYYGHEAYFTVLTRPGKGTAVEFYLPVSHDPEEYAIEKGREER